jgi:GNAT superfamily N-acetyltransferase
MNIEIKPLTPELVPDYLDFFDHRAFSDASPNGPCYCTSPSMTTSDEAQMISEFSDDVKGTLRRYAVRLLAEEKIRGYLAFDNHVAIGWCNAGDRDAYVSWIPESALQNSVGKTLSVVCFAIAPEYRGMGIAYAMLERILDDAKAEGYTAVEGYARKLEERQFTDYNGPIHLFKKAGFAEIAQPGELVIMRKELR